MTVVRGFEGFEGKDMTIVLFFVCALSPPHLCGMMSANYADIELGREKKEKYIDPDYFSVFF